MPSRYSISVATAVMLVVLRLTIGWHFFSEGVKHVTDSHWSSEGFLRAAKGPLAPLYHSYAGDSHRFEELMHGETAETPAHAAQSWIDEIQKEWDTYRQRFAEHYGLSDTQQAAAVRVLKDAQADLRTWAAENKDGLAAHVHAWHRKENTRTAPAGELPYQKQRTAQSQAALNAEANGWLAQVKDRECGYAEQLSRLLDVDQRGRGELAGSSTSTDRMDAVMKYGILAIGLLLIVGLFTRLACLAGAAFLLSVAMSQPFWIADAQPTINQLVEMIALLALATTEVGRWGGLDYFFPGALAARRNAKGVSDVS